MWRVILPKKKLVSVTYDSSFIPHESDKLNDFISTSLNLFNFLDSKGEKVHIESTLEIILPADKILSHIELECITGNTNYRFNVPVNMSG